MVHSSYLQTSNGHKTFKYALYKILLVFCTFICSQSILQGWNNKSSVVLPYYLLFWMLEILENATAALVSLVSSRMIRWTWEIIINRHRGSWFPTENHILNQWQYATASVDWPMKMESWERWRTVRVSTFSRGLNPYMQFNAVLVNK